jgi:hypothetical protein
VNIRGGPTCGLTWGRTWWAGRTRWTDVWDVHGGQDVHGGPTCGCKWWAGRTWDQCADVHSGPMCGTYTLVDDLRSEGSDSRNKIVGA